MRKPQTLKKGDTIAIASPAGAVADATIISGATATLSSWGLNVITSPHCLGRDGYYSGSTTERTEDFISLLNDDNVKAILCSYGGYGCLHIADAVAESIAKNPKWIIGMSDCSVLHAAALSKGIMSLHSPQCRHLTEHPADESAQHLRNILFSGKAEYITPSHQLNIQGKAQGRIVGGNLSVLHALISTKYNIFEPGRILFIEDINEPAYRIERMFYTLKLSGVLKNLSALIVGQFTFSKENSDKEALYKTIHNLVKEYKTPVCFNFPIGHCTNNFPIIEGATATLNVENERTVIEFE